MTQTLYAHMNKIKIKKKKKKQKRKWQGSGEVNLKIIPNNLDINVKYFHLPHTSISFP
jgi:hypothetical protein